VFIDEDGPLHNPEHEHLDKATIGFAWAPEENSRNMRRILGQTELMPPMAMGKWQRGRAIAQMADWFGEPPRLPHHDRQSSPPASTTPASAPSSSTSSTIAPRRRTRFGHPKFHRDTGEPMWGIRGHDVEEFVGVVARYGTEATGTTDLVKAGAARRWSRWRRRLACGTCAERRRA
jgi:hypothetical protein